MKQIRTEASIVKHATPDTNLWLHIIHDRTVDHEFTMDIDANIELLPNELAFTLAQKCRKWMYSGYSTEYEGNDIRRPSAVDKQYEALLERAMADLRTKVHNQQRVLDDVQIAFIMLTIDSKQYSRRRGEGTSSNSKFGPRNQGCHYSSAEKLTIAPS
jgi:hypothetical protein